MTRPIRRTLAALALIAGTAQAHPDFSGVWKIRGDQFALMTVDGQSPPLLPDAAKAYAVTKAKREAGDTSWDGVATKCKPPGVLRILLEQMPFEIMQQDDKLLYSYQWNRLDRLVFIGKKPSIVEPTYFSISTARWDGDTLVVDAQHLNGKITLDRDGMPSSDQLHLTEHMRLSADGKTLTDRITVSDPVNFSHDWETELTFERQKSHIQEDVCEVRTGMYKE